jgi:diguanylate cyclase (GGDEF)-like protein/hemerythrin-like metal-binding protein
MAIFQSMKFRLIGFGVLLVVAASSMRLFLALPLAQESLRELVAAQQLSIASYVARDIDHSIQTRRALIGELVATLPPELLQHPGNLAIWVQERQRVSPLFNSGLLVTRPDGSGLLAQYPVVAGRDKLVYSDTDWFQAALSADVPVMSKPQRGRASGEPIVIMAAPVRNAARQVVAVVAGVAALNAPGFLDRLQEIRLGESGGFLLISPSDNLFVGASDPAMVLKPTPAPGVNPLHDRAMAGYRGTGVTINAKGAEELSAMASVPSTGWFVVARMSTAEAFRPIDAMRGFFWTGSLATIAALIVILMVLLPRILRPLTDAARAMREMAGGKRELAPLPVKRQDEVGDLVLGFNHLVATLHEKGAALDRTMKRLDQLAGTDALTGAWNRRQFDEVVERELDRSRRYGHPISLLLLDLDLFKEINDKHGHAEGDRVLQQVADCIRATLRNKSDSLTRWGGEEFMILVPDTRLANAAILAERVRANIASHGIGGIGSVTASIGVAEVLASESREHWVARADAAMYRAKHAGRNRVEVDTARAAQPITESEKAGVMQLVWSDHILSGNQMLDSQHRGLFDDSNKLLAAILSGRSGDEIGAAIDTLMRDMVRHFRDEEKLLLAVGYPGAAAHAALHVTLVGRAVDMVERFRGGGLDSGALFQFLARDFVAKHILSEDREFFSYLDQAPS